MRWEFWPAWLFYLPVGLNYLRLAIRHRGFTLHDVDIGPQDFIDNIRKVIYHLDYPVAGPGSFPQYMVSQLASKSRKVVLGGQGGDVLSRPMLCIHQRRFIQ